MVAKASSFMAGALGNGSDGRCDKSREGIFPEHDVPSPGVKGHGKSAVGHITLAITSVELLARCLHALLAVMQP